MGASGVEDEYYIDQRSGTQNRLAKHGVRTRMKTQYTLTLTGEQAKVIDKAVELLLRLKLGQYEELPFILMDINTKDFGDRIQEVKPVLMSAFKIMNPGLWTKDLEWHRLYDIHQVIRHAIHGAEHPNATWSVDAFEPICTSGEALPKIRTEEEK